MWILGLIRHTELNYMLLASITLTIILLGILAMVIFSSSRSRVNFRNLEEFLANKAWKEADKETSELMEKITKYKKESFLGTTIKVKDYANFPRKELCMIDSLWVKYSNGRFGFSVQKKIWIESGGSPSVINFDAYKKFITEVGWRKDGRSLLYSDITFNTTAPEGHLPCSWRASMLYGKNILIIPTDLLIDLDNFFFSSLLLDNEVSPPRSYLH
jgi:hypothetical protein